MGSEIDFNRLFEQMINRPIESSVDVSAGFSAAGTEIGTFLFFLMLLFFVLLVFGLFVAVFWFAFVKK